MTMRNIALALFAVLLAAAAVIAFSPFASTTDVAVAAIAERKTVDPVAEFPTGVDTRPDNRSLLRAASAKTSGPRSAGPLPPLGVPLSDIFEALDARARAGDAAAACRLGAELMDCSRVRGRKFQIKQQEELMARRQPSKDPIADKKALDFSANLLARETLAIEAAELRCAGVDESRFNDIYDYQRVAAESGHLPSLRFFLNSPALEFDVFAQIEQYRRFPADAQRLMERAVRAGDGMTLARLLSAHRTRQTAHRFEMRVYQALFQSPEELEVFLEVAKLAGVSDRPPIQAHVPEEPAPPTMCPGHPRCDAIRKRAQAIAADFARNSAAATAESARVPPPGSYQPGHTCVQIADLR